MAFSNKFRVHFVEYYKQKRDGGRYGTLYGDLCGGIAVLADVYKTKCMNSHLSIETKQLSQSTVFKTSFSRIETAKGLWLITWLLHSWSNPFRIYWKKTRAFRSRSQKVFEQNPVNRILKLVNRAEFKRHQSPPVLRISTKAFGQGRRLPIETKILCINSCFWVYRKFLCSI